MKLLTNKQFQGEIDKATEPLKEENEKLRSIISKKEFRYLDERDKYKDKSDKLAEVNEEHQNLIVLRENAIKELEKSIKKFKAKENAWIKDKDNLINQINELQNKLSEAELKLSQRFILKEIPTKIGRPRKSQIMKTKSSAVNSKIIKKVKEVE